MIEFDEAFPGGCCVFEGLRQGELHVRPNYPATTSGNQYFWFLGRLTGAAGPQKVCLHWPPTNAHYVTEYPDNHQVSTILDRMIFTSEDLRCWTRIPEVKVQGLSAHFTVQTNGKPLYVAAGMPYTENNLQDLLTDVRQHPLVQVTEIARSLHGRPVHAIRVAAPEPAKDCFYLQGLQHASEWAGGRIIDNMIRFLTSKAGRPLLELFTWHFVPVVNVDGVFGGWREDHPKNLNRDWNEFELPEPSGVRDYIASILADGSELLHAIDFHMGWFSRETTGAAITVFKPGVIPEEKRARQERFTRHVFANTVYTDRIWESSDPKGRSTFAVWTWNALGITGQTFECSRHLYPAGPDGTLIPSEQAFEEKLAVDLLHAITCFDWQR